MAPNTLLRTLLSGTRRRIVRLLRAGDRTVRELASELDLTRNAIRAQLSKLKGEDLVEVTGRRPTKRKPEHVYGLTDDAEALFPKAYHTVLNTLLAVLADAEAVDLDAVINETGRRLAQAHKPHTLENSAAERVERARQVLADMGGLPALTENGDGYRIEGTRCPVGAAVEAHGTHACDLARALIEELTELPVERRCTVEGECPQCAFVVAAE